MWVPRGVFLGLLFKAVFRQFLHVGALTFRILQFWFQVRGRSSRRLAEDLLTVRGGSIPRYKCAQEYQYDFMGFLNVKKVYTCIHTHTYLPTYVRTHIHLHTQTHTHTYTHTHTIYIYICIYARYVYIYIYIHTYTPFEGRHLPQDRNPQAPEPADP